MYAVSIKELRRLHSSIRHEEKLLRKKRRWLMGLQVYDSSHSKMRRTPKFLKDKYLDESFLRSDDVSCEFVRTNVERSFHLLINENGHGIFEDYRKLADMLTVECSSIQQSIILRTIYAALDDLNNNGLFRLACIAAGRDMKCEKTRPKMKAFIRKQMAAMIKAKNNKDWMNSLKKFFLDSSNFQKKQFSSQVSDPLARPSVVSAATVLLQRLGDMGKYTLQAMHRKLRGVTKIPKLKYDVPTLTGQRLVNRLQIACTEMLSELSECDDLPSPLAKAMSVGCFGLREQQKCINFPLPDFYPFSPETRTLQNQILKAIKSLKNIHSRKLIKLKLVLDPRSEISNRSFRSSTRRFLIEHLYECGDVAIPKSLLDAVAIINGDSHSISKEAMEEEVECVLNLSSQLQQVIWKMLPDENIELEYVDAYMDDLESADEVDGFDIDLEDDIKFYESGNVNVPNSRDVISGRPVALQSDDESIGDSNPFVSPLPVSSINFGGSHQCKEPLNDVLAREIESEESGSHHSGDQCGFYSPPLHERIFLCSPKGPTMKHENQYLAVKNICDEASVVAYQIFGSLLEEFLGVKHVDLEDDMQFYLRGGLSAPSSLRGDQKAKKVKTEATECSILVEAVKELVPSFPQSGIEKVKELMGLL